MNIVYLANSTVPSTYANSVHVVKMCQAFSAEGHSVSLFYEGDINSKDEVFEKYGVEYKFNLMPQKISRISKKIFRSFSLGLKTYRSLLKSKLDIDLIYGRSITGIYLLKNKRKFMYESHIAPKNRIYLKLEERLFKHKNFIGLVVISHELKQKYLEIYEFLESDQVLVLHDGADDYGETENISRINLKSTDGVVVGYLGHLYPGKSMEIIIEIAKIKKDLIFNIVGGTEQWVNYWKEKVEADKIYNIVFYGFVNHSKVKNYYAAFDIILLPFQNNVYLDEKKQMDIANYFSPLKLFEAMSMQRTIMVSSLPTIKEVVTDNVDAIICDPNDINKWVNELEKLIDSSELRNKLGKNARKNFLENYSWNSRAIKICEFFEKENN